MHIRISQGSVLDASTEAVVLPIDATTLPKQLPGNVALQFARRWPDVWSEAVSQLRLPVALGCADYADVDEDEHPDCSFETLYFPSFLHHIGRSGGGSLGFMRSAFAETLRLVALHHVEQLATPLLVGGWRVDWGRALTAMVEELDSVRDAQTEVTIWCLDPARFDQVASLAQGLGVTT